MCFPWHRAVIHGRAERWYGCSERLPGGTQGQQRQGSAHVNTTLIAYFSKHFPLNLLNIQTLPLFFSLSSPPVVPTRPQPESSQRSPEPPTGGRRACQPELPVWHPPGERKEDQHQHRDRHKPRHGRGGGGSRYGHGSLSPHPAACQELQTEKWRPLCGGYQRGQVSGQVKGGVYDPITQ